MAVALYRLARQELPADTVYFLEKFANTYLGITVGEHLGTLLAASPRAWPFSSPVWKPSVRRSQFSDP